MNKRSTIVGFAAIILLMSAAAAQGLAGENTVDSGDIIDGTVKHADIKPNTIGSSRMLDNSVHSVKISDESITGVDIADNALSVVTARTTTANVPNGNWAVAICPPGYFATGGGDPFESTTSSEDGATDSLGGYTQDGEVPRGWAVRNTSGGAATIEAQVICIRL